MAHFGSRVVGELAHFAGTDNRAFSETHYYRLQRFIVDRPTDGVDHGTVACARCGASVGYRVLSGEATRRRRSVRLGVAVAGGCAAVITFLAGIALAAADYAVLAPFMFVLWFVSLGAVFFGISMYREERGLLDDPELRIPGHSVAPARERSIASTPESEMPDTRGPRPGRRPETLARGVGILAFASGMLLLAGSIVLAAVSDLGPERIFGPLLAILIISVALVSLRRRR